MWYELHKKVRHHVNMKRMEKGGKLDSSRMSGPADDCHRQLKMQRDWESVLDNVNVLNMVLEWEDE